MIAGRSLILPADPKYARLVRVAGRLEADMTCALSALRRAVAILAIATLALLARPLHAADWPTKPVTVIVPFGAGGNTDMMARLAAQHLSAKFGQTFVVENRPGAGGALGTGQVATAAPDGYTLLFSASANIVLTRSCKSSASIRKNSWCRSPTWAPARR